MSSETPYRHARLTPEAQRRLWFGLVAAPATLALHEFVSSSIAGAACADGEMGLGGLSDGGVRILIVALTLLAIGIAGAGGLAAWRSWRTIRSAVRGDEIDRTNRAGFMAVAGLMVTALSVVGLVYSGLAVVFIGGCHEIG